jgi:tetratricopeptide (TPR) repeat protein
LPEDLDPRSLDVDVRNQLRALARDVAEQVALRLLATAELIDADPETALAHALVARRLASRIAAVREAVGLAAYRAGQWQTAIGELRAYHRMTGRQSHLAVLADCERALGRPERAIDMYRAADRGLLTPAEAAELLIVAAGARADLGQWDAAVAMLQVRELTAEEPWVARLRYAYAGALLAVGRREEAREWFARAAEVDEEAATDAAERLLDLDGVILDDREDETELDDLGLEYLDLESLDSDSDGLDDDERPLRLDENEFAGEGKEELDDEVDDAVEAAEVDVGDPAFDITDSAHQVATMPLEQGEWIEDDEWGDAGTQRGREGAERERDDGRGEEPGPRPS